MLKAMRRHIFVAVLIAFLLFLLHSLGHKDHSLANKNSDDSACVVCDCFSANPGIDQQPVCVTECPCEDEDDDIEVSTLISHFNPATLHSSRAPPNQ